MASIGNGAAFHKGREFAAWMGLVPKQYSTGGKAKLYGISKRGNRYLRKILIHGARAVVLRCKREVSSISSISENHDGSEAASCQPQFSGVPFFATTRAIPRQCHNYI